jgi:hypothetical protein
VCRFHGAATPQAKAKAVERLEDAQARAMLVKLGEPDPIGSPTAELLAVTAEAKALHGVLRARVAELVELASTDALGVERERAVVALYERSFDRFSGLLINVMRLNLEERAQRLEEAQAVLIARVVDQALTSSLAGEQLAEVRRAVAAGLREVSA